MKRHTVAAADTLPPTWRTASELALEDEFVLGGLQPILSKIETPGRIQFSNDERLVEVAVDPDSNEVTATPRLGEVPLGIGSREPLMEFANQSLYATYRRQWADRSRANLNTLGSYTTTSAPHTGLQFELPGLLPRQVQSLLGPGSPALNVSGSENIRLSGESNWSNQQIGPLGQKRSLFPSLDMQQDLNIQLEGQLSDRIRVNLLQNSLNQIPLANRIAINYKGDEDDLIQELDLGNTNLSLPGTQYVSYSGRNEGLFGIKASSRFGPLDMTVLASKQEGRSERASYTGGASRQTYTIYGHEFVKGVYFMLYDPDSVGLDVPGAQALEINDAALRVYRDDGTGSITTDITIRGRAFPDPLRVGPDTSSVHGNFRLLQPGVDQDYQLLQTIYGPHWKVLKMRVPLSYDQKLAVTYAAAPVGPDGNAISSQLIQVGGTTVTAPQDTSQELVMKLIRPPLTDMIRDEQGNYQDSLGFTRLRHLELANFYQLPGQRIDASTLKLTIQLGDDEPPKTSVQGTGGINVPYIEVFGLDNLDETTGRPVPGHDAKLDGTAITSGRFQSDLWVDTETGVLHFLEPRPFAPRPQPFEEATSNALNRRLTLDNSTPDLQTNPVIYDRYNPERKDDAYRIIVEFTAQSVAGDIQLGRTNIIQGSEVVTVNGRTWLRDVDYNVDYDLGRITLKKALGPADNLSIDYSYAPLFQQAGRTLVGSAFQLDGINKSLGGAFMYESHGAQDLKPRLGEEPSRSVIGDLNGKWSFTPDWMTRLADRLPGVRTTTPSEFDVEGEVGASFPNPNTKNQVYIDDMEGVRDAVSLSMGQDRWRWSSAPSRMVNGAPLSLNDLKSHDPSWRTHNAEVHWYTPFSVVQEHDLKPTMTQAEGGENAHQVLAISVPKIPDPNKSTDYDPSPIPGDPVPGDSLWVGLTYPLDVAGIDLTKSQFIELWLDDFNDRHTGVQYPRVRGDSLRLHIDLGVVSEDQQRSPDVRPNNLLDTEDQLPRDNQLTVTDKQNEDTGYDGFLNAEEKTPTGQPLDLTTAGPGDPEGDDFGDPDDRYTRVEIAGHTEKHELDTRRFRFTNGTEGNKRIFPYPDTEDLNLNSQLDTRESYFEYTINLGDPNQKYLITDVLRDFAGKPGLVAPPTADNGWRRYRIPIADSARIAFGTPDLALVRHLRVWIEGIRTPDDTMPVRNGTNDVTTLIRPLVLLGGVDIVGSRWRAVDVPDSLRQGGSTVTLNSVNTIDNADIYVPPFNPGQTHTGSQTVALREQSLSLEFTRLLPGQTMEAYKSLSLEEDYSLYKALQWYATGFDIEDLAPGDTLLDYFVRFSSDESGASYYEYRAPLTPSHAGALAWQSVNLAVTELSNLKLAVPFGSQVDTIFGPGPNPGERLSVVGRPSFTRLRRISFGLINRSSHEYPAGQLWFNELRAGEVEKTPGHAERVLVNGKMANLMTYSASYSGRDANFLTVGETRGQGSATDQLTFNTSIDTHRFFEGTGIVLPVTYGYARNTSKPRFTVGDDVVRTGAYASASESRSDSKSFSVNYSRNWSDRANPLLLYTLGGITAGYNRQDSHATSASEVDTTISTTTYVNYRQSFRKLLAIPIPLMHKVRLFPLPDFSWAYNRTTLNSFSYDRLQDSTASLVLRNRNFGDAATLNMAADVRPTDLFTYHVDALRNLSLGDELSEHLGGVNVGRVTGLHQSTSLGYTLNAGQWLKPTFGLATNYSQDKGPQISSDLSVRQVASGQSYTARWDLPFENMTATRGPRDSTRRLFDWRRLLSRLGNVSADGAYNKSSAYSRINGAPDFAYMFGFSDDPGIGSDHSRVQPAFGNQIGKNSDWRATGRTRLNLGFGAFVSTQAEVTSRIGEINGVQQRQDTSKFPDLTFEYGRVVSLIRLDRLLDNPQLQTAYSRNRSTTYQNDTVHPTNQSTASQWQPLMRLRGALKNGTAVELGVERRNTISESFLNGGHTATGDRQTTLNFSLNRSYTQGQKINLLGKTSTVKSSINMGLSANYDRHSGETTILSGPETGGVRNPTSDDRLSLQGNGSYGFSNNVTGTATLGFEQDRNLTRSIVNRSIRVELRGSFTF